MLTVTLITPTLMFIRLYYSKETMSPVTKNILILLFFVWFVSYIGQAEAGISSEYLFNKMFYRSLPDSQFVNLDSIDKCMMRNWVYCEVA